ncbi:protein FAM89A-like [Ruditapes philippinarum]|uniref:protein FAM89A-like n=1 Tax=Ruditapes philippinarum TaxID=129788 RepID=UPI00295B75A9|nr:protein FAM89A-like [Ruditapes philippinarum]
MSEINGLPPLPQCFDGLIKVERTVSETSLGEIREGTSHCLNILDKNQNENTGTRKDIAETDDDDNVLEDSVSPNFDDTPFSKLNTALRRLKNEMAGLRKLDVTLLYQLWTLHEAIQEYKAVMQDQYSDMGSEYSWGGLSSRACSITSIDSCDFNEDYTLQSNPSIISSLQGSTTSLIQQIEELKVRAETEF